mmetsp:Transcript_12484/g.27598  ORF Transcript_12484/g.27598 Transcript_12484/m.27598 type:complete len:266 (-) Transcript_12484:148-945(-)
MQSSCRWLKVSWSEEASFLFSSKSFVADARVSLYEANAFLAPLISLFSVFNSSSRDCFSMSKWNRASVSSLVLLLRWASAFSNRSSNVSRTACRPPLLSPVSSSSSPSLASSCCCTKACKVLLLDPATSGASMSTVTVLTSCFTDAWLTCTSPAICFLNTWIARSSMSCVSAISRSRATNSPCSLLRTAFASSRSASFWEMDALKSSMRDSVVAMSELAFSTTASKESWDSAEFFSSCCFSLAFSSHHTTNSSNCCCSTSPSAVT